MEPREKIYLYKTKKENSFIINIIIFYRVSIENNVPNIFVNSLKYDYLLFFLYWKDEFKIKLYLSILLLL